MTKTVSCDTYEGFNLDQVVVDVYETDEHEVTETTIYLDDGTMRLYKAKVPLLKKNFKVEDIDGCEFAKSSSVGKMLLSLDRDELGFPTGRVQIVYPDGSGKTVTAEEAQKNLDDGTWLVFHSTKG